MVEKLCVYPTLYLDHTSMYLKYNKEYQGSDT